MRSLCGKRILKCWSDKASDPIQPWSASCRTARYQFGYDDYIITMPKKMRQKKEGLLLAKACTDCKVMAQALANIPDI